MTDQQKRSRPGCIEGTCTSPLVNGRCPDCTAWRRFFAGVADVL